MATSSVNKPTEEPQGTQSQTFNDTATIKKDKNSLLVPIEQSNPIRGIENNLNSEMPNVDLKKQFAGGQNAIQVIKEQEGPTDIIYYTDTIQDKKVVKVPKNDLSFSNSLELTTETELGKKSAGNLVNASDAITDNESEGDNNSETVECAERCKGSDEELPKNVNLSLEGYTGNPDKDELSNTCTVGCERGNSGNGSDCIDNEKVASEDELSSSVIPLEENESDEIANQIVCEKKIDDKFDEIDCKSEGKKGEADRKYEAGNFNASCQRGDIDKLATETELDKKIAGNLVNASDGITDNDSEGDNSSETVECAERCEGSDEELPKNINQSSEGYTGIPDKDELSNTCTAGCQRGKSGNGSDCIDNEKVASEDELASSVIPLQENESGEITNQIVCEKKIDGKFDEKDCKSEGKKGEADRKYEVGNFNASCQSDEIDEVEGKKGVESKNASVITSTTVTSDKIKIFKVISFYYVKVAYKFSKGYTKNICLQTIFICTMMYQQYDPQFSIPKNTISAYLLEDMIQDFYIGNQEYNVFAVLENNLTSVAMAMFLPEPDLPRSTVQLANTLGINLRPYDQNTTNSGSMDRSQPRVDSSQSIQHTGTSSGGHQSNDELQRCSEFISISSLPMTATVREGETDSQQVQRCTRINDVPGLPVPNQLNLDEGSTNRKETQAPVRNIFTNIRESRQSADGSPSSATTNLRGRNIPTIGTYSLERISEYASHLSNSVSEQPSQQISDDMVFGEERMSNELARARTFNDRWPHRHLNPGDMARAGFFFTGEEDMTRCFDCDIGLGKWETDDSPFTEHRRLSPECRYIQSLCQNDPQLFGASGQVGRTGNSNLPGTGDAASGGQQNDIQGLGHRRTIYRQMERQEREDPEFLFPHGEHGDDDDSNIYSELLQAQSCESEHTGIQESGTYTGLTMFAVTENSRTLQDSPNLDSADVNELIGTGQTFDAIDYRGSQEVIMVLSEGYSQREVDIAVESLLNEDSIITVNALRYKLQYLGFTPKI
ncbi:uncharacterized protein LOC132753530 [Ruditapes philippinarum]|uniref:uncharacterized protein LOC132753530 n=1 Tax=Ruditapes philippinarum TaxID=129788 RepID=UPI00295A6EC4|nr:uncharacterized protein LOC132753530 [Ruditapes philippinarum]